MEENLLKTCLYDKHVALGAQMSPFGGFIMPIQYTNITDEHNAVRHKAGMFDVSHMGEIFVSGPDAEKFVNHVFSNNIAGMLRIVHHPYATIDIHHLFGCQERVYAYYILIRMQIQGPVGSPNCAVIVRLLCGYCAVRAPKMVYASPLRMMSN